MTYLRGILYLSVTTFVLELVHCCDSNAIVQCANDFKSAVGEGPLTTEAEITGVCTSEYPTFQSCIAPHKSGCGLDIRTLFESLDNLYDYMCKEGKSDAVSYNPCLGRTALKDEVKKCKDNLDGKLSENRDASQSTKCGYMENYLECVKTSAKDECGADAAEFQDKTTRLIIGPSLEAACGCSAITAMMWLVGGALILQWLIR